MQFENEDHLQAFIYRVVGGEREVVFNNGKRIDILTGAYAIEVKPNLTRSAIYQAMGQLIAYKPFVGNRELVIAGVTPKDVDASESTAREAQAAGMQVWYVDQMPQFQEAYHGVSMPNREQTEGASALSSLVSFLWDNRFWLAAAVVVGWIIPAGGPSQTPPPPKQPTPAPTGYTNLYKEPSETSPVNVVLKNGASLTAELCQGDWVKTDRGWVEKSKLSDEVCN